MCDAAHKGICLKIEFSLIPETKIGWSAWELCYVGILYHS